MFLIGIILQRLKSYRSHLIAGKGLIWLSAYLLFCYLVPDFGFKIFLSRIILATASVSLAYTKPWISQSILRDQDISYGTYIYHMVIVNIFVALSLTGKLIYLLSMIALTLLLSTASWIWIEKPALRKKRETIKAGI
jgi:peptidoglycan/LPS O-acetylase OafA/YrhL